MRKDEPMNYDDKVRRKRKLDNGEEEFFLPGWLKRGNFNQLRFEEEQAAAAAKKPSTKKKK